MDRIFYGIFALVLFIILIIACENDNTNLIILDGIALILCQNNYLYLINKEKKGE